MKKVIALCIMFGLLNGLAIAKDEALTYPDSSEYVGQVKNGKANGKGTLTWPDGGKYTGQWKDVKHARTEIWADGSKYTGQFKGEHPHGDGIGTWSNGDKYEGQWKEGKSDGEGTMIFPDGGKYVGQSKTGNIMARERFMMKKAKYIKKGLFRTENISANR